MERELNVTIEGIDQEQAEFLLRLVTLVVIGMGGSLGGGIVEVGNGEDPVSE